MKQRNMKEKENKFGMKLSDLMNKLIEIGAIESYQLAKSPFGKFTQNPSICIREAYYDEDGEHEENGDCFELENCEPISFTPDMDDAGNQKNYPELMEDKWFLTELEFAIKRT